MCGTRRFATVAEGLGGTLMFVARTGAGAFYAAPETPHAFCPRSAGSMRFGFAKSHPAVKPHDAVPPPPEGAAPGGFPLGLLLAVGGEKNRRGYQLPFISLAACACLTLTRSASLAALMLALRSLNARGFRAFLRRFRFGGAKSLPCGLRARGRPARHERVWADTV